MGFFYQYLVFVIGYERFQSMRSRWVDRICQLWWTPTAVPLGSKRGQHWTWHVLPLHLSMNTDLSIREVWLWVGSWVAKGGSVIGHLNKQATPPCKESQIPKTYRVVFRYIVQFQVTFCTEWSNGWLSCFLLGIQLCCHHLRKRFFKLSLKL